MKNDLKQIIAGIHYKDHLNFEEKFLVPFLFVFSIFYQIAVKIRLLLYKIGVLKQVKLNAFVISVGNLTTGGTGKTPLTAYIANFLSKNLNKKVAVISRGYGGKLSISQVNTVSDGKNVFYSAHLAGDEPYWIAQNTTNVAVFTGKNRIESAIKAIKEVGAEILILDDGFQHLKIKRDLNLMLIDANLGFGNNQLLPLGPLREPLGELKRADKVILVNKDEFTEETKMTCVFLQNKLMAKFKKPCYTCNFTTEGIYNIKNKNEQLSKNKVYGFTGIARPVSFFNFLEQNSLTILKERTFIDHHLYTMNDFKNIISEAKNLGAEAIVTTEKDAVKLKPFIDQKELEIPFYVLKLGLKLDLENILGELIENIDNQI